jgi:anti-sigma factor RsiW
MTHAHVKRRLSAYLEGELEPREEERLESHLLECAPCAAELRALRRAVEMLRSLPAPEPTRDLSSEVIRRIRAGEARPRWERLSGLFPLSDSRGWLAPLALAMGVGALLWMSPASGPQGAAFDVAGLESLLPSAPAAAPAAAARSFRAPAAIPTPLKLSGPNGIALGASEPPAERAPAPAMPSIASCLEHRKSGGECAGWDHWWLELALADARRFAHELNGLPDPVRGRLLQRLSEFAARSGSATLVGDELRRSRDPGAVRYARRFERGNGAGVVTAGWSGR